MTMELTDALLITKKFKSSTDFGMFIDEIVNKKKVTYMEAVIGYCDEADIDVDSISSLINQKLKEKIQVEAEQANMIRPRGHLPF